MYWVKSLKPSVQKIAVQGEKDENSRIVENKIHYNGLKSSNKNSFPNIKKLKRKNLKIAKNSKTTTDKIYIRLNF